MIFFLAALIKLKSIRRAIDILRKWHESVVVVVHLFIHGKEEEVQFVQSPVCKCFYVYILLHDNY